MIKPIETRYAGCRFRSRLEARWAVFFDALKIRWEYEKEGYEFDGFRYLPDFYLPDLKMFFEVKSEASGKIHSMMSFFRFRVAAIVVAVGFPGNEINYVYDCHLHDNRDHCTYEGEAQWYFPTEHEPIYGDFPALCICGGYAYRVTDGSDGNNNIAPGNWYFSRNLYEPFSKRIEDAYACARSARFEFGESG